MLDILTRARALIADPANWMQGAYSDRPLADPDTKCFCLIGALDRAHLEKQGLENFEDMDESQVINEAEHGNAAIAHVQQFVKPGLVSDFNDWPETTHADVLALLDKAIAAA